MEKVTIGNGVTSIERLAFNGCTALTDVYYKGAYEQFAEIYIDSGNSPLKNATIYYNYR